MCVWAPMQICLAKTCTWASGRLINWMCCLLDNQAKSRKATSLVNTHKLHCSQHRLNAECDGGFARIAQPMSQQSHWDIGAYSCDPNKYRFIDYLLEIFKWIYTTLNIIIKYYTVLRNKHIYKLYINLSNVNVVYV